MARKNKSRQQVFNPPTRYPQGMIGLVKRVQEQQNEQILKETNNTLNLVTSAYTIVLREFYDIQPEQLKEILERVYEQLELCADEIVTIDQMMDLCSDYGLEVTRTADKLDEFGTLMLHKTAVFELLDKGVTEVEDLARQAGTTGRLASAFRWQYNKIKYGKDYMGDEIMASKRELAYEMFEKGIEDKNLVAKEIESTPGSVTTYYLDWKKNILGQLGTDEAASYLAGEKKLHEVWAEHKAETGIKEEEVIREEPVKEEEKVQEEPEAEVPPEQPKRRGLRKRIEIDGEFAQYRPAGQGTIDVIISDQVITLTKEELLILTEELPQIADEEVMWK